MVKRNSSLIFGLWGWEGKGKLQGRDEGLGPAAKLAFISDSGMKQNFLVSLAIISDTNFMINSTECLFHIVNSFPDYHSLVEHVVLLCLSKRQCEQFQSCRALASLFLLFQ